MEEDSIFIPDETEPELLASNSEARPTPAAPILLTTVRPETGAEKVPDRAFVD